MTPTLYWIEAPWPGRLAIGPRPRGGDWLEDEISSWRDAGIDVAASLLTTAEMAELGLEDEAGQCQAVGIRFARLPVEDRDVPSNDEAAIQLIESLGEALQRGRNVVIHCRQGVGRSGMMAALLLTSAGVALHDALVRVGRARGIEVPETAAQFDWVKRTAGMLPAWRGVGGEIPVL